MFKIIRRILVVIVLVLGIAGYFQWNHYQEILKARDNALLYFSEEDYEKAIEYLQEGLEGISFFGDSTQDDMNCYLAESYYQLGNYENAIKIYNKLLKKHPKDKIYYLLKGEVYEATGDTEQAVEVYLKGWEKTEDSDFLKKVCDSYIDSEDYETALQYAEEGAEVNEDSAKEFMFKKIIIYEKLKDYESAYQIAKEYTEQYPDDENGQKEYKFLSTRI